MIDCETERANEFPQIVHIREHTLRADVPASLGGADAGPSPHDLFDAALVACKTLTVTMYAKAHAIPLERVEAHVERDASQERQGTYKLAVRLAFHGPLDAAQRQKLHEIAARCPVHKLMTTATVEISTAPLEAT